MEAFNQAESGSCWLIPRQPLSRSRLSRSLALTPTLSLSLARRPPPTTSNQDTSRKHTPHAHKHHAHTHTKLEGWPCVLLTPRFSAVWFDCQSVRRDLSCPRAAKCLTRWLARRELGGLINNGESCPIRTYYTQSQALAGPGLETDLSPFSADSSTVRLPPLLRLTDLLESRARRPTPLLCFLLWWLKGGVAVERVVCQRSNNTAQGVTPKPRFTGPSLNGMIV